MGRRVQLCKSIQSWSLCPTCVMETLYASSVCLWDELTQHELPVSTCTSRQPSCYITYLAWRSCCRPHIWRRTRCSSNRYTEELHPGRWKVHWQASDCSVSSENTPRGSGGHHSTTPTCTENTLMKLNLYKFDSSWVCKCVGSSWGSWANFFTFCNDTTCNWTGSTDIMSWA